MALTSLTNAETTELARRLAELAQAGLPLAEGLRAASDELSSHRLKPVVRRLATLLDQGQPLEAAIASMGAQLPEHLCGLVLAGVRTGQLPDVLEQFVQHQRLGAMLRRRVLRVLAYPMVLFVLVMGLILFFATTVAEVVRVTAADFDLELPIATQTLLSLANFRWSDLLLNFGALIIVLLVALCLFGEATMRSSLGRIPLIGPIWRWTSLAEFCRLLGLLVERDTPLAQALMLAAGGVPDGDLRYASRRAAAAMELGQSFAKSIANQRGFPPSLVALVGWGEKGQTLAPSLRGAAAFFELRALARLEMIRAIVPPVTFLFVLSSIGFLVSAAMLPLIKVIEALT